MSEQQTAARRKPFARSLLSGVALTAILATAWVVKETAPGEEQWQAGMPVAGAIGDTLTGRNIEATVHEVRIAESVTASTGWAGPTTGIWVVAEISVAAVVDDIGIGLGTAELAIGDVVYSASDRPADGTIIGESMTTGLALTGPIMFEISTELLDTADATHATLRFAQSSDSRLDSLIVVPVDLRALDIAKSIETDEPVWGNE
ncbi:MAG TPA: hypothetical protein VGP24_03010 [Glaciihabitans sp.]|jgi:hypothetical protein|nr:hypothetical protein [Glaciihabitans sp.]